jgi:hypothetical protein
MSQVKPIKSLDLTVACFLSGLLSDSQDGEHVPSKRRWTSTGLHVVTPPKTVLFLLRIHLPVLEGHEYFYRHLQLPTYFTDKLGLL